jgi:hypothetical protein
MYRLIVWCQTLSSYLSSSHSSLIDFNCLKSSNTQVYDRCGVLHIVISLPHNTQMSLYLSAIDISVDIELFQLKLLNCFKRSYLASLVINRHILLGWIKLNEGFRLHTVTHHWGISLALTDNQCFLQRNHFNSNVGNHAFWRM